MKSQVQMTKAERASVMRIFADLIKSDGVIDMREMTILDELKKKYGITKEDEVAAASCTLKDAVGIVSAFADIIRYELVADIKRVAMCDDFCAREEALLLTGLRLTLLPKHSDGISFLSIDTPDQVFESSQILYVESEWNDDINGQIKRFYREICTEVRLAGFEFVYLPNVSAHYRSLTEASLRQVTEFLYPNVSQDRMKRIISQMQNLSTSDFCKNQLATKFAMKELEAVEASFMINIGISYVNDRHVANFLLIETGDNVLTTIRGVIDLFAESYNNLRLNYAKQGHGRFIFTGYYKQVLDILMLRRGIRSAVVIDPTRERIYFLEADVKLDMIHRREKALYALFLMESESGGINFSPATSTKHLERYNRRMKAITRKYKMIYRMFGGDESKAPNIESPEIRMPMISLLKRQMMKLRDVLYRADDYIIQRNIYGNYSVRIPPSLCYCSSKNKSGIKLLSESEEWQEIAAL